MHDLHMLFFYQKVCLGDALSCFNDKLSAELIWAEKQTFFSFLRGRVCITVKPGKIFYCCLPENFSHWTGLCIGNISLSCAERLRKDAAKKWFHVKVRFAL